MALFCPQFLTPIAIILLCSAFGLLIASPIIRPVSSDRSPFGIAGGLCCILAFAPFLGSACLSLMADLLIRAGTFHPGITVYLTGCTRPH